MRVTTTQGTGAGWLAALRATSTVAGGLLHKAWVRRSGSSDSRRRDHGLLREVAATGPRARRRQQRESRRRAISRLLCLAERGPFFGGVVDF